MDDDVRNIFALSSVLERRGMTVLTAGTGREAIATLDSTPDLAIVLMDIMMPEMDGYETMQVIRQNPAFQRLPIIALTAKAMKGDREVPGSRRVRLPRQTGEHRATAVSPAYVAAPLGDRDSVGLERHAMSEHEKVNILMVDDQPAKLLSYEVILSELGENLIKAGSGREALEHLLKTDIAVVLMDVSMPEIDGFELADLIRQHPRPEDGDHLHLRRAPDRPRSAQRLCTRGSGLHSGPGHSGTFTG